MDRHDAYRLALGPAWAPVSSTYRITIDTVDSGAAISSSASFGLTGRVAGHQFGKIFGLNYIGRIGFYPGAFEIILSPIVTSMASSTAM